jgi:hypothetical protein
MSFATTVICYLNDIGSVRKHGKYRWIATDY